MADPRVKNAPRFHGMVSERRHIVTDRVELKVMRSSFVIESRTVGPAVIDLGSRVKISGRITEGGNIVITGQNHGYRSVGRSGLELIALLMADLLECQERDEQLCEDELELYEWDVGEMF